MAQLPDTTKIVKLKEEVDLFLYEHQEIVITSAQEFAATGDKLKMVQNRIAALEDKRKEYTRPLDDLKKTIMADFKQISEPLEEFVKVIKGKMLEWSQAEQKRLDEKQKKIEAEALEKAKAEGISEVTVPVINTPTKTQRGDFSTTTVKKVWKWEVVDETVIPREYLCIDNAKITQAVREGVRDMPGVKIYQEDQLAIR